VQQTQPGTVLHAGCGKGELTALLVRQNPALAVVGLDPNPEAIAFARTHFHEEAEFLQGSLAQIPFPDDSFDLVICNTALAYVEDPARVVEELKRVSRKHVAIAVPREPYFTWFSRIAQALGATGVPPPLRSWNRMVFRQFIHHHFDEAVMHMNPFRQIAECSMPDDATRVIERHYGLEALGIYRDCTISGAYRYEVEPNPRAIYQTYAFKNKALLFIQVLQVPILKPDGWDPLDSKEDLEHVALREVMARLDSGYFEVGEQYEALLL